MSRGKPKQVSSPISTGGGGVDYERHVGAFFLAQALLGSVPLGCTIGFAREVRFQRLYAGESLDDLIVVADVTDGEAKLALQVKRDLVWGKADDTFDETIRSCWTTFTSIDFKCGVDAFGVVVALYSKEVDEHYQAVLLWARNSANAADFWDRMDVPKLSSAPMRQFANLLRAKVTEAAEREVGDDEMWEFLRHMRILRLDLHLGPASSMDYSSIVEMLRRALSPEDVGAAPRLFTQLAQYAAEANKTAGSLDVNILAERLRNDGFTVLPPSRGGRTRSRAAYEDEELHRHQFESLLQACVAQRATKGIGNDPTYVQPTLYWQHDLDRNPILSGDPDARESWLTLAGNDPTVSLSDVVHHARSLIIAEFNAGKTRLLERIVEQAAQRGLEATLASEGVYPVPILVRLRDYRDPGEAFPAFLKRLFRVGEMGLQPTAPTDEPPSDAALRSGHYLFLLDGLDEVGGRLRPELLERLRTFIREYPHHSYVMTTRRGSDVAETLFTDLGFEVLTVVPFSERQIREYVAQRGLSGTDFERQMLERRDLRALARVPGLLKLLCDSANEAGELPARVGAVYETLIAGILDKEAERHTSAIPRRGLARDVLNLVALTMMRAQVFSLPAPDLEALVTSIVAGLMPPSGYDARQWIEEILDRELLISDGCELAFQHRSWQEYLAACALRGQPLESILPVVYVESEVASGFNPLWYQALRFLTEMRLDMLRVMYEREPVVAARCTPLDADDSLRLRALATLLEVSAAQKVRMLGGYDAPRDVFNDRQTCVDLAPTGAVQHLRARYHDEEAVPVAREDAFELLMDYAARGSDEAREAVAESLPALLQANVGDWGVRESATYAVSRLDLPQFLPELHALYGAERDEHVRKAALWSLAMIAPREARDIFVSLLIERLGARLHDSMSELALRKALPSILDDEAIGKVRERLQSMRYEPMDLPEGLVELLLARGTSVSREALIVVVTHLQSLSLDPKVRQAIYDALIIERAVAVRYILEHVAEPYVGLSETAATLAALLDEATAVECEDVLMSSALPPWVMNLTAQYLKHAGKRQLAERLHPQQPEDQAQDSETPSFPRPPTLSDLLEMDDWRTGRAFGPFVEEYADQISDLSPAQREQLRRYVEEALEKFDPATAFCEDSKDRFQVNLVVLACLIYATPLAVAVAPVVYEKLLAINFNHATITRLCDECYTHERDDLILSWLRPDVPEACLRRSADLCAQHRIRPLQAVQRLGNVLTALCANNDPDDPLRMNTITALARTLTRYGRRGVSKLDTLIQRVDGRWTQMFARMRLSLDPPSPAAEGMYLSALIERTTKDDAIGLAERLLSSVRAPQSVPLLFDLLRTLLSSRHEASAQSTIGALSAEDEVRLLLAEVLSALTRLASAQVLEGFGAITKEFPDETWLSRSVEDVRRLYLVAASRPDGA